MSKSNFYRHVIQKPLFCIDPELAHNASLHALRFGGAAYGRMFNTPPPFNLQRDILGLSFPNPIGLAAGYDKNASVVDPLFSLGFGFVEVGSLTPKPQSGNPKPRLFRLPKDEAIINRMGFNNDGHKVALGRLRKFRAQHGETPIVAVNIGANKQSPDFVKDYQTGLECFWKEASYFVANISSPNTPGLRDLQASKALRDLLDQLGETIKAQSDITGFSRPVVLKVAPDLDENQIQEIAELLIHSKISGLSVGNTTLSRTGLQSKTDEAGGLSGRPLFDRSTRVLARFRTLLGSDFPIIGVGGIHDFQSAWEKLSAGADLIQLYSALVYNGPQMIKNLSQEIASYMANRNIKSLGAVVGTTTKHWAQQPLNEEISNA